MFSIHQVKHFYQENLVLDVPQWEVGQGEHWLLLGSSGSGKTTLLHILGGLLSPSQGSIHILQQELHELKGVKLDKFRAKNIGIVFQKPHLIATLSVLKNLLLAQYMAGIKQDKSLCEKVLHQLNLSHRKNALPQQLSQGEAQRVSVARAILNKPKIILADEPTASLDDDNAQKVIELLKQQAQNCQATLIVATHDYRVKTHFELQKQITNSK
jgi:putative ABC transport system ATP-binding protein